MEKIEIFPYHRVTKSIVRNKDNNPIKTSARFFTVRNILINIIAFTIGRAIILSKFLPFGLPFYASYFTGDVQSLWVAISIVIALLTKAGLTVSIKYVVSIIIFTFINLISKNKFSDKTSTTAIIASACLFIAGFPIVIMDGLFLYDIIMLLFELSICFAMVYIFKTIMPLLIQKSIRKVLSNEEIIGLSILLGLIILGFFDIRILGNISFKNTLCIFTILIFALKSGVGVAASTGVTIGLINSMSSPVMPYVIGSYAFCGLIAGVFRTFGKIGVSLGFILANAILTIYVNGSTEVLINIYDIFAAVILISIIPQNILDYLGKFLDKNIDRLTDKTEYSKRVKEITVGKLNNVSKSFDHLANTFNSITDKNNKVCTGDISVIFDKTADRVCRDCGLSLSCWEREFHNTYQIMFKILEKLEEKGHISKYDVPSFFANRCIHIDEFIDTINNVFEIYKVNLAWKDKISESRGLVSQQLKGISNIIDSLASEITVDLQFDEKLEDIIMVELDKNNISSKDITVLKTSKKKHEVEITVKNCKAMDRCSKVIPDILSRAIGKKMVKVDSICACIRKETYCNLKYVEAENFNITTGIAKVNKKGQVESGDNYSFMQLNDGQYILALSDGMGSGKKAFKESNATISLLEQFLETGFDKNTAVQLINSVLILKSPDECFATIDLSVVDLYTGNVEFIKIGAAATFIKKKDRVEVIKSTSLPVGILNNVDIELSNKTVSADDYIIMISDGILDSNQEIICKEEWVKRALQDIKTTNPQQVANELLRMAIEKAGNNISDDMTVLAVKVWENAS